MSGDNDQSSDSAAVSDSFGASAFITVDKANCLYQPERRAAVRVVPPYGTEVEVIRDEGNWVLIRFCGKEAWSPRENLSPVKEQKRPAVDVGIKPPSNYSWRSSDEAYDPFAPVVEYGPRGGRFVRTALGFRRYL